MATRLFTSVEGKIAPSVPGCPRPVIEQYVRDAAIEVCEKTLVWRYEQPLIRLTPGVYDYDYETPDDTEVVAIIHSAVNGAHISPATQDDFHRLYPAWPSTDVNTRSMPRHISQFDPDQFILAPTPDNSQTYDIKLFVALKPTPDASGMDKTPFDECEQLIVHGALQHLLVLPDKSWTDRELATYHAKQFTYKTASRRAKANLGVARASMGVQMRPLA
jgi:hypothetical protein